MQITLKLKFPSHRAASEQRDTNSGVRSAACSRSFSRSGRPSSVSVSRGNQKAAIVGVSTLNHFLDLPKKLPEPASNSSSTAVEIASEELEKTVQIEQIPIEEVQVHPSSRIVVHTDPRSAGADRFRFLRMCLRELWNAGKLKSLQITSALPQDGKSTVAMNLATALAEGGKRTVLLIEADLHRPTLTQQFDLERRPGLADCLEEGLTPLACLRRLEPLGWYLLPAGEPHTNPTELLQTDAFAGVLQKVSPHFDWVLIDSPPVIPLTDALSLARQASATLMVAREGRTPREAIEKAIAILGRQRVLGIVLNAVDGLDRMYSGYYGYGGYPNKNGSKEAGRTNIIKDSPRHPVVRAKHSILPPPEK
jgi:protein-tyrosine kinase